MLNLRSGLVLTAAGLCLWALFELLSHLKEPGILRSEKASVIKGCDDVSEDELRQTCAPLFCQKALVDQKQVPWNARFTLQQRPSLASRTTEIVIGSTDAGQSFACAVQGKHVMAHRIGSTAEVEDFVAVADDDPATLVEDGE